MHVSSSVCDRACGGSPSSRLVVAEKACMHREMENVRYFWVNGMTDVESENIFLCELFKGQTEVLSSSSFEFITILSMVSYLLSPSSHSNG